MSKKGSKKGVKNDPKKWPKNDPLGPPSEKFRPEMLYGLSKNALKMKIDHFWNTHFRKPISILLKKRDPKWVKMAFFDTLKSEVSKKPLENSREGQKTGQKVQKKWKKVSFLDTHQNSSSRFPTHVLFGKMGSKKSLFFRFFFQFLTPFLTLFAHFRP